MRDRNPSCDRLHPGEASIMAAYKQTRATGDVYVRHRCKLCARIRMKQDYVPMPRNASGVPQLPLYGVLPRLTWTPPQV